MKASTSVPRKAGSSRRARQTWAMKTLASPNQPLGLLRAASTTRRAKSGRSSTPGRPSVAAGRSDEASPPVGAVASDRSIQVRSAAWPSSAELLCLAPTLLATIRSSGFFAPASPSSRRNNASWMLVGVGFSVVRDLDPRVAEQLPEDLIRREGLAGLQAQELPGRRVDRLLERRPFVEGQPVSRPQDLRLEACGSGEPFGVGATRAGPAEGEGEEVRRFELRPGRPGRQLLKSQGLQGEPAPGGGQHELRGGPPLLVADDRPGRLQLVEGAGEAVGPGRTLPAVLDHRLEVLAQLVPGLALVGGREQPGQGEDVDGREVGGAVHEVSSRFEASGSLRREATAARIMSRTSSRRRTTSAARTRRTM